MSNELIPVISHELCVRQLVRTPPSEHRKDPHGYDAPPRVLEPEIARVVSGVNYVGAQFTPDVIDLMNSTGGRVEMADPCALPEFKAKEIAKNSTSLRALRYWATIETRQSVVDTIEERLREIAA